MFFLTTLNQSFQFPKALASLMWLLMSLGLLSAAPALANPVPADDLSIANGYEAYDMHCARCHGTKTVAEDELWYEPDAYEDDIDYEALIDEAQAAREEAQKKKFANIAARDGSGRWAELPDPGGKANDADVRAQIMADLVAQIDKEYGANEEVEELDPFSTDFDIGAELGFDDFGKDDAMPGAPDLADPEAYLYGTDERDLYRAITKGIGNGSLMPGFLNRLGSEEAVWDLVNYIRSQWGPEWLD